MGQDIALQLIQIAKKSDLTLINTLSILFWNKKRKSSALKKDRWAQLLYCCAYVVLACL
jgi:hypothetical protein